MYDDGGFSDAMATDMNSMLHSSTFKHPSDGEFSKMKDTVSSNSYSNHNYHEHNYNQGRVHNHIQSNLRSESSLTRYRSAPSSFYAHLLEDDFLAPDTSSNQESFFPQQQQQQQQYQQQQQQQQQEQYSQEFIPYESSSMKLESDESGIQKMDFPTGIYCENRHNNNINNHHGHNNPASLSTFRSMNPTSSNLIRQSSSPAGFLSTLNSESGFGGMRDVEKTISSSRLNNHISFSPGFLPQIPENKNQTNDSTFKSLKRSRDGDSISLERQNGLSGHYNTPGLVHHLSLPKTSTEMAVAENFLQFGQQLVPSKSSRAARGCATHPRSIAERVRRTRISARMKKLQDLFPNMDKQTSTADMLDMAVQYIIDLQKDLETLKEARSRCECSSEQ